MLDRHARTGVGIGLMKTVAVIMAGGSGERFWPLSRCAYPKQLLKLQDDQHMLDMAVERILPLVPMEDIHVVTVAPLVDAIYREMPELVRENIIAEPEGRNTAACLALASAFIAEKYGEDVVMAVFTADHFIKDLRAFQHDCRAAAEFTATSDGLLTFGIRPNRPETGYGYIEVGASASERDPIFHVDSFREKPDRATAERFLQDGDFFWNSGMFFWKNSVFQAALQRHLPAMAGAIGPMRLAFQKGDAGAAELAAIYARLEKISIDVGLMERAEKVFVLRASFDWDDIGTWASLYRILPRDTAGNATFGDCIFLKSTDSVAYSVGSGPGPSGTEAGTTGPVVIGYNLKDIVIVHTPDAILVLPADEVQNVKDVVAYLRANGKQAVL